MAGLLKLRAEDSDDLVVISTVLQDAVVPLSDMIFEPAEKRFVLAANRFRWEDAADDHADGRIYERQHCGIRFERVAAVKVRALDQQRRADILSLLAIEFDGDGAVDLLFAGGGVIRLEVEALLCQLDDFEEPWPTMWRPTHPEAGGADG